jgi:hypothetical protein
MYFESCRFVSSADVMVQVALATLLLELRWTPAARPVLALRSGPPARPTALLQRDLTPRLAEICL